jgi:hypothetical protein
VSEEPPLPTRREEGVPRRGSAGGRCLNEVGALTTHFAPCMHSCAAVAMDIGWV